MCNTKQTRRCLLHYVLLELIVRLGCTDQQTGIQDKTLLPPRLTAQQRHRGMSRLLASSLLFLFLPDETVKVIRKSERDMK